MLNVTVLHPKLSTTVFYIGNKMYQQISALKLFLKDHVTLKTF